MCSSHENHLIPIFYSIKNNLKILQVDIDVRKQHKQESIDRGRPRWPKLHDIYDSLKDLVSLYKSVKDKCIVTARPESMRNKIESVLKQFGLQNPKWGLHMCPDGKINAGQWKGEKIVELAKATGFQNVIFYDDNSKYIKGAKKVVSEELPNLNFKTVKV